MSYREAQLRPRTTWERSQGQDCWLWPAIAREAEGQAHLLHPGRPVPQLLREGGALQGRDRREVAAATRAAPRQRCVPPRVCAVAASVAAIGAPWARCG